VEQPDIDPAALLDRLRDDHAALRWEPLAPTTGRRPTGGGQVRGGADLAYLHEHWTLPDSFDPGVAGGGLRGRVVSAIGRVTFRVIGPYLREERALLGHLVRVNDALEQRCDALTLRCEQLEQDMVDRQVAEASNLAELALWLHRDPPVPGSAPPGTEGA
jgi:hypothetical protein